MSFLIEGRDIILIKYFILFLITCYSQPIFISVYCCKNEICIPGPDDRWTQAQKTQNNEFIESRLENRAKMSWMTNKVDLNNKNKKID